MQVLILVNDFQRAKSRLSPLLTAEQRRALATAMLRDVLDATHTSACFDRIAVLAGCEQGCRIARENAADSVLDATLAGTTLNDRVRSWLLAAGAAAADPVLFLHADLPLLRPADLRALVAGHDCNAVTLATDTARRGTNALLTRRGLLESFAWGADSAARHRDRCHARGVPCHTVYRDGLARDIDEPAHLALAAEAARRGELGAATSELLLAAGIREPAAGGLAEAATC